MMKSLSVTLMTGVALLLATVTRTAAQSPIWTSDGPWSVSGVLALAINPTTPTTL